MRGKTGDWKRLVAGGVSVGRGLEDITFIQQDRFCFFIGHMDEWKDPHIWRELKSIRLLCKGLPVSLFIRLHTTVREQLNRPAKAQNSTYFLHSFSYFLGERK